MPKHNKPKKSLDPSLVHVITRHLTKVSDGYTKKKKKAREGEHACQAALRYIFHAQSNGGVKPLTLLGHVSLIRGKAKRDNVVVKVLKLLGNDERKLEVRANLHAE